MIFLEDDETYYYVAKTVFQALKAHAELYGAVECDGCTMTVVDPRKWLVRVEEGGITEDFPDTFERLPDVRDRARGPTVGSTAAEWALFYEEKAPLELMSSVYADD